MKVLVKPIKRGKVLIKSDRNLFQPPNYLPVAVDDYYEMEVDEVVEVEVLVNDYDPDNDEFFLYQIVQQPQNAVALIISNTEVRITPNQGFIGSDYFIYNLIDTLGRPSVGNGIVNFLVKNGFKLGDQILFNGVNQYIDLGGVLGRHSTSMTFSFRAMLNNYQVRINSDDLNASYLCGIYYDNATKNLRAFFRNNNVNSDDFDLSGFDLTQEQEVLVTWDGADLVQKVHVYVGNQEAPMVGAPSTTSTQLSDIDRTFEVSRVIGNVYSTGLLRNLNFWNNFIPTIQQRANYHNNGNGSLPSVLGQEPNRSYVNINPNNALEYLDEGTDQVNAQLINF